jgi:NitT/TauT family transport system permease protein
MRVRWLTHIRTPVPRTVAIVLGLLPIAAILLLWWWATAGAVEERVVSPTILPSPVEVVRSVGELFRNRALVHNTFISLKRVSLGYLLALVIVFPLGVLMGTFGVARATFTPLVTSSGYIPIATLVPLTMSWFGIGEQQKIIFLAIAFGIFLLPAIITAIEAVPEVYLRTAYTLGAGRIASIFRVLIPVALPAIWNGMRLAFGVGWTYLVLTEVVSIDPDDPGLGALIAISQRRGPREHIYLIIIVITVVAWVADRLWQTIGSYLFPYRKGQYA